MKRRRGLTLLEVLLSLALSAVVAVLIGGLIQLFLINEARGRESLRQTQTARAILNMIAEDIRTSVRYQPYDTSGLQQMLSGAASSMAGGMMSGGGMASMGLGGGAGSGGATGGTPGTGGTGGTGAGGNAGAGTGGIGSGGQAGGINNPGTGGANLGGTGGGGSGGFGGGGGAAGGMMGAAGSGSMAGGTGSGAGTSMTSGTTVIPPGLFGTESSIEIDISRMPRPDEYVIQQGDVSRGTLGDMPSDIKTVGYYVQSPRSDGILDPLAQLASQTSTAETSPRSGMSGGLVRRSLDRAVTQYAYTNGKSDQLSRTGEIITPAVLGVEFSYYNPNMGWQTQWDSSQLGLPYVVKVTIAMQTESKSRSNPLEPGLMLSTINSGMIEEYGIQFYSTNVIIPGASLLSAPSSQSGTGTSSNGMSSMGL